MLQIDVPVAGEGEVLVKMLLRPVNPADIRSIKGALIPRVTTFCITGSTETHGRDALRD